MKTVPKVNTEGFYFDVAHVEDAFSGVVPFYEQPETIIYDGDEIEKPEPVIAGYIVGVPFPEGFGAYVTEDKTFRFDLVAWKAYETAKEQLPPPEQPIVWVEGLSAAEIAELTKDAAQEQDASAVIGQQLSEMKLQTMQQQQLISGLGAELAAAKLELINLKGAGQ
ncbi:hypothetical protein BK143_09390 [Paenibacillus peoriae]|uniref:hypothetical protein n=1 Tax=Paenibacillus TaxID=44249 RepID=UPI00096DF76D|nr:MULTISPECIES: hypothetical protein [Paenibacillus]OMF72473.1 hypothetical protein BK143_09390 [Paenibacillus peoriae]